MNFKRVWITGGTGFLGQHVVELLTPRVHLCITSSRPEQAPRETGVQECNLLRKSDIDGITKFFKPDVVVHLAATVGGIGANRVSPGRFMYENLQMGLNLIESMREHSPNAKLVNVGTVCSYPKFTPVPFKEEDFWNGYPEETNAPYGIAKKTLIELLLAYEKQYNFKSNNLILANLYGPGDSLDVVNNHVVPAMIKKFLLAEQGEPVQLWGDGTPSRDFLYVKDAAKAIYLAVTTDRLPSASPINIGTGVETKMRTLAHLICHMCGKDSSLIAWNTGMPNGQPRRVLNIDKAMRLLYWEPETKIHVGLRKTVEWMKCQLHV